VTREALARRARDPVRQPAPDELFERARQRPVHVEFDVAIRADEEDRQFADTLGEMLNEVQARFVGPVEVLEDEHEGLHASGSGHEFRYRIEEVPPFLLGRQLDRRRQVGEQPSQLGHDPRDLRPRFAQGLA
jgi:hypothetical protein